QICSSPAQTAPADGRSGAGRSPSSSNKRCPSHETWIPAFAGMTSLSSFPRKREPRVVSITESLDPDHRRDDATTRGRLTPTPYSLAGTLSLLVPLLDLLDLVPVGLRVSHRFERDVLQNRVLEGFLVDRRHGQPLLPELVGQLALTLLDFRGRVRRRLLRHVGEDLLLLIGQLGPHVRRDLCGQRVDDMACQDDVLLHLVELFRLDRRE